MIDLDIKFHINNPIEEFRLRDWGGEKKYVLSMISSLNESDVFLDVGSSVGLISVIASKKLKSGNVISIEPDPENRLRLEMNYSLNKLKNYNIFQIAAGEKRDKLTLYTAGSNGYSPSLKKVNGIDRTIIVEVNSIDNLISENKIPIPDIVKIDIEGAEFLALKGMSNLMSSLKRPRIIFVELHPEFLPEFNTNTEEILNYMKKFKYRITENIQRDKQILCQFTSIE
jgi:FkbM family methyltransferase